MFFYSLKKYAIYVLMAIGLLSCNLHSPLKEDVFVAYVADLSIRDLDFYQKNDTTKDFCTLEDLKLHLANQNIALVFAMPVASTKSIEISQNLYIENRIIVHDLMKEKTEDKQINGILYTKYNGEVDILKEEDFQYDKNIKHAMQAKKMLLINQKIPLDFDPHSKETSMQSGVGVLSNRKLLFVISKEPMNSYDFAAFFLHKGCKNAILLNETLAEVYLPEQNHNKLGTDFGVLIGVTKPPLN
ncbi:MAG: hypothetical protein GX330_03860 [Bacteroidales bacterium]|nr:hypothetical protein [Bacteroidales bacterium]